jgi:hypothetical protein
MDVLACLSCGQRYAVRGEGALGGQRCTHCNGELEVVPRDVSRVSLAGQASGTSLTPLRYSLGASIHSCPDEAVRGAAPGYPFQARRHFSSKAGTFERPRTASGTFALKRKRKRRAGYNLAELRRRSARFPLI